MIWAGQIAFGCSWIAFRGQTAENTMHAHAALQLTLAHDDEAATPTRSRVMEPTSLRPPSVEKEAQPLIVMTTALAIIAFAK